jgi:hypothetical protein
MRIGWSTGYYEQFWGRWPFEGKQYGGSERIVVKTAIAQAKAGHSVTVRLPWDCEEKVWEGVRWIGQTHGSQRYDRLFCADDFSPSDRADARALVACRSDPPRHAAYDALIFLSKHHASLMGCPEAPAVGGGVDLAEYVGAVPRLPRRVICTSSPDRCPAVRSIGKPFDFVHTYKPVAGFDTIEVDRDELIRIQRTAKVLIYPLDPRRPSDFFSMAVLEALAAGTPVITSDADSMPEMWTDAALILPRPIDLGQWYEAVTHLLENPIAWRDRSKAGRALAAKYDWSLVANRYLEAFP